MHTSTMMKAVAVGAAVLASQALASTVERSIFGAQVPGVTATCNCKNAADCTCPKGQCKCKNCGNGAKAKVFDSLKGTTETTRLPDTARFDDARGGVLI